MSKSKAFNPIDELLDLRSELKNDDQLNTATIYSELWIGKADVPNARREIAGTLSIKRAFIALELDGFEIAPGSRNGDRTQRSEQKNTVIKTTDITTMKASGSGGINLDANSFAPTGNVTAEKTRQLSESTETQHESSVETGPVRALGGDRWEISGKSDAPLDTKYMDHQRPLCILNKLVGSNRQNAKITANVKRYDLNFKSAKIVPLSKDKLITAFIASRISHSEIGKSQITLSTQELGPDE